VRAFALALVLLLAAATPVRADDGWSTFDTRDGVTYARRPRPGSHFNEYRAVLGIARPPVETGRTVWNAITNNPPATVKKRVVLSSSEDDLVVYQQIRTPVVSDRDVTLHIHRTVSGDSVEITFESASQLGPPPSPSFVRLPIVRGKWTLTPTPGGTHVVYECFSEPGGSVPAFLVRGTLQSQVQRDVERALGSLPRLR
jgi:hypothetical protein